MKYIKKYINALVAILKEKGVLHFFILGFTLLLVFRSIEHKLTFNLFIAFIFSFILQSLLLLKKSYVFYLIRILLIVFICFEIIFGRLNYKNDSKKARVEEDTYNEENPILGYRMRPNISRFKCLKIFGKDTIYNVLYSSDKYSRRVADYIDTIEPATIKSKHALFLGCSYTFGEGLPYESTFSYLFEKNNPDYKSYNYGYKGYGPHQSALFFKDGVNTLNKEAIEQNEGFAVYTFINDHLNRVYGGSIYLSYGHMTPDVYINNNKLVSKKRSKFRLLLAEFLINSQTMKYFHIRFSYPKTEAYYKRFADIINYTADQYIQLFPKSNFYVGLFPNFHEATDSAWVKYLNPEVSVISVPPPADFNINRKDYIVNPIHDSIHPNEKLNTYYVNYLSNCINKKKQTEKAE